MFIQNSFKPTFQVRSVLEEGSGEGICTPCRAYLCVPSPHSRRVKNSMSLGGGKYFYFNFGPVELIALLFPLQVELTKLILGMGLFLIEF